MQAENLKQLSGTEIAVTIDDQWQWTGIPFPPGRGPRVVAEAMIEAFANHSVPGVYAFNSTAAAENDPTAMQVLDVWCQAGHFVGNHTHQHISLNWLDSKTYISDIEASEKILQNWIDASPSRYFRYAFGMEGDTVEKTRQVQAHLSKTDYLSAPVTLWFYDAQFMVAYDRAIQLDDHAAMAAIEDMLVTTAVAQIERQVAAAHAAIGRKSAHIMLIHGTTVAGATIDRVLGELAQRGVSFVTLEKAMADPVNLYGAPLTTRQFRNSTQKWAQAAGIEIDDTPPAVLTEVEQIAPIDGMSYDAVLGRAINQWTQRIPFTPVPADFH